MDKIDIAVIIVAVPLYTLYLGYCIKKAYHIIKDANERYK